MINIPTLGIYVTVKFSGVALPHALTHLGLDIDRWIMTEKKYHQYSCKKYVYMLFK